jgi:hypothetical protein
MRLTNGLLLAGTMVVWIWFLLANNALISIDGFPDRIITIYRLPALLLALACLCLLVGYVRIIRQYIKSNVPCPLITRFLWIPLLMLICLCAAAWSTTIAGLLFLFGTPLLWSWGSLPWFERPEKGKETTGNPARDGIIIFFSFTVFFAIFGTYFTEKAGEHAGDEGHYLIQAHSLFHDGDLDLRNNFTNPESIDRGYVHISSFSRGAAWFSWHSPGISFLLAPTVPMGIFARHLLLGVLSGLALAGLYLIARELGSCRRSASMVTFLLGLGAYWGIYSSRALPEVLGATLTTWGYYCCLRNEKRPITSTVVAVICIGALPWAQTRFIPVALMIMGFFGMRVLLSSASWMVKIRRLIFFTAGCLVVLGFHQMMQWKMFDGGQSYPVRDLLFSYPAGMWHTLASQRGILFALPMFACMLAASVYRLGVSGPKWPRIEPLSLLLAVLVTSCATPWFTGGASLPGRFLLVVTPVLAANMAYILSTSGPGYRLLTVYLGLVPIAVFTGMLPLLEKVGRSFPSTHLLLYLHGLFDRMPVLFYDPYEATKLLPALIIYLAAFILLMFKKSFRHASTVFAICTLFILAGFADLQTPTPATPRHTALLFEAANAKGYSIAVATGKREPTVSLLEYSDRFADAGTNHIKSITSKKLHEPVVDGWISEPWLDANDWEGRNIRWVTLVPPFTPGRGYSLLSIRGENTGESAVEIVVREGATIHYQSIWNMGEKIDFRHTLQTRNRGDLYILSRFLENRGELTIGRVSFSSFQNDAIKSANISLD